jgi:hypothetical protein
MSQQRHITRGQSLLGGLVVIALGAWAASASWLLGSDGSWEWTADRIVLAVLPGAAAALGGLGMIGANPRAVRVAGLLALAGGLWFMVAAMTSVFWAVVEQAVAVRSRARAACEPRHRPSAVQPWAARRNRVHAGGRTHAHPGNDPAP